MEFIGSDIFGLFCKSCLVVLIIFSVIKRRKLLAQLKESNHKMKIRMVIVCVLFIVLVTPMLSYLFFIQSKPHTPDNLLNVIDKIAITCVGHTVHKRWVLDPQTWFINNQYKEDDLIKSMYNPTMDLNASTQYAHRMRYYF